MTFAAANGLSSIDVARGGLQLGTAGFSDIPPTAEMALFQGVTLLGAVVGAPSAPNEGQWWHIMALYQITRNLCRPKGVRTEQTRQGGLATR